MSEHPPNYFTSRALRLYGLLALIYVLLILALPANSQVTAQYHLSGFEYRILLFAVMLPSIAIWAIAFYGYAKLEEYAYSLKADQSEAFQHLAEGCRWLAWSLPATAMVTLVLTSVADSWSGFASAAIIITNYVALILPLIGFSLIGAASRSLFRNTRMRFSATNAQGIMIGFLAGGVLYCYLIFRHMNTASLGSADNPYHLPLWLVVLTIIIPYLYAWFIGLLATYEIISYSKQVRGVLYRQALHLLIGGLAMVILGSIGAQYVASVRPIAEHLVLDFRLLLIIIFHIVAGAGFALIASGAVRLKKMEEI